MENIDDLLVKDLDAVALVWVMNIHFFLLVMGCIYTLLAPLLISSVAQYYIDPVTVVVIVFLPVHCFV